MCEAPVLARLGGAPATSLVLTRRFAAPRHARRPSRPFAGTLEPAGAQMEMSAGLGTTEVLGNDTTFFPRVAIRSTEPSKAAARTAM
jgi:hypothetical protein